MGITHIRAMHHGAVDIRRWAGLLVAAWLMAATAGCSIPMTADRTSPDGDPAVWPQDQSDLAADPSITFGRLANGLRYLIKENETPRDRVSMHLYIQAGSLLERPAEQGAAHFLEHMLFNGSTHFPPGEMVKYFQRIGMQFGPDANAHTGFVQTVYDVILPAGDEKSLAEGLLVLRDYADGALLLEEEVVREKKVILAEMRSRDSARFRTLKSSFAFEMPGLLVSERFPIGLESTIQGMDGKILRDFYTAWYRPEHMILILTGDMDTGLAADLIARQFNTLKPMGPARNPSPFGKMEHQGIKGFYHYEEEAGATTISIETVKLQRQPADSADHRQRKLLEDLASRMIQKRLDRRIQGGQTVMTSAQIFSGYYLRRLKFAEIRTESKPSDWRAALSEIEQVLRQALVHGFTAAEFQRVKDEYRARLVKDAKAADTRDSKTLTREAMHHLNNWKVILSPEQKLELLGPFLEEVTLEMMNQAINRAWAGDHRLVLATGNARIPDGDSAAGESIAAAFKTSQLASVAPVQEKQVAQFPYLPTPSDTGTIVQRQRIDDLGIEQIRFGNGVVLHLKRTDFKDNEVKVALSFGDGKVSEPEDQPGLSMMTQTVINESGFGAMDYLQLQDALAGKVARARLKIREDMFVVNGQSVSEELPLLFQLLYAFLQDPGYRSEARDLALKRWTQQYQAMARTTDGAMRLKAQSFLAGGDRRFGMPPLEQLQQRTLDQIRQWYGRQLRQSPMALAVVGDFEPETVVELATRYLASLPERDALPAGDRSRVSFPAGETLRLTVDTDIPKALVVVAYPTEDFWNIERTRRLTVMAELLSERLRAHIREELGAAYSPFAFNRSLRAYAGYGSTQVHLQVDPDQAEAMAAEVKKIASRLTARGVEDDEFRRILDPTLTYIKDVRQTNSYWLDNVLTGAARYPQQFDWSRSFTSDYAAITAREVIGLAGRYLDNRKATTVIITPSQK